MVLLSLQRPLFYYDMKRLILTLFLFAAVAEASEAKTVLHSLDSLEIGGGGNGMGGGSRAPIINDLQVSAVSLFGIVYLIVTVQSNLGMMDFSITNLDTGEYLEGEFNAQSGSYPIPISNSPGHYRALFTLTDGRYYEKEFIL